MNPTPDPHNMQRFLDAQELVYGGAIISPSRPQGQTMQAQVNAYEAPQTTNLRAANEQPHGRNVRRFPGKYLWRGMVRGLTAGLVASLSMILLYLARLLSGYQANAQNLLLIAGVFIVVTMVLGLAWGIAYACFVLVMPDSFAESSLAASNDEEVRGAS